MNRRQTKPIASSEDTSISENVHSKPQNNVKVPRRVGGGKQQHLNHNRKPVMSANVLFVLLVTAIAVVYGIVVFAFYQHEETPVKTKGSADDGLAGQNQNQQQQQRKTALRQRAGQDNNIQPPPPPPPAAAADGDDDDNSQQYPYWKDLAVKLAAMTAKETLIELNEKDPFGTRTFENYLLEQETKLGRLLTQDELEALFPCPSTKRRITLPDQRNHQKAKDFRDSKPGTFLFFQHLRKAGGTHFCSLAKANLPQNNVAAYYCMPDMNWSGGKHAGYLHSYKNDEFARRMAEEKQRIAGNEWDWFDVDHHFELPAVFATSFRKPLDRALSQFRFECIEDRGCKIKDVHEWWDKRVDLYNVYTQTFADTPKTFGKLKKAYENMVDDASQQRMEYVGRAMDTLAKFNIVLAMEFLAYAGPQVEQVLGFRDTSPLAQRVRPHIAQFKRNDGQEQNMGAAGIHKASWDPEEYLDKAQYQKMSEHLALDMILTDAARRMFLERLVCKDLSA